MTGPADLRVAAPVALPDDLPGDRHDAWVLAHRALEQLQLVRDQGPTRARLERWAARAEVAGWPEVHVQLLDCLLVGAVLEGAPPRDVRRRADALLGAALRADDEVLLARAIASRVQSLVATDQPGSAAEDFPGELARAVAMLDDAFRAGPAALGRRAAELPAGYVECGIAYYRYDLWELENEMYDRAARACTLPFAPEDLPVVELTSSSLPFNRQGNDCTVVCAMLEVGHDVEARELARRRPAGAWLDDAALPELWVLEVQATEHLLAVVAAGPDVDPAHRDVPAGLYDALGRSTWTGYQGFLHVAAALARRALGDLPGAAEQAERALERLDGNAPTVRTLALSLATLTAQGCPAHRYAQHLAQARWNARRQVLAAARARLAAARTVRDGEALRRALLVDDLTGLGNRRAWSEHVIATRGRGAEPVAVVLVDLDRFKAVNDTFGHAVGDDVLRAVGTLLRDVLRPADLAVRLGGDEFALVLGGGADPGQRAQQVVDAVRGRPWHEVAPGLAVTASAGQASGTAAQIDALLATADARLYAAKAAGRDRAATDDEA